MTHIRTYALNKHDVFTITSAKYLLGVPVIILRVYKNKKWYKPYTWFRTYYVCEYIGDNIVYRPYEEDRYVEGQYEQRV